MWKTRFHSLAKRIQPVMRSIHRKEATVPTKLDVSHRLPPPCSESDPPYAFREKLPCFDINSVQVERADQNTVHMIKPFIYENYFTREPCLSGLCIPISSPYLVHLADRYSNFGDRWLAFEVDAHTNEKVLIGVAVASKKYPWEADVYESLGHKYRNPERLHMYFHAHCYRHLDLFKKYKVPFIYNIDVVVTKDKLQGLGVGDLLLRTAILYAIEMHFPIVQFIATNTYMKGPCIRAKMTQEWSMKYSEFVDHSCRRVLSDRIPHTDVNIFIRRLWPLVAAVPHQLNTPGLYQLFEKQCADKEYYMENPGTDKISPSSEVPLIKELIRIVRELRLSRNK